MTTTKRTMGDIFETVTCSRCAGEKRLPQYSNVIGGTCFKCSGTGKTYTKRGAADLARYREAVRAATMRPVRDVKVGDAVRSDNMKRFVPVIAIGEPVRSGWTAKPGKPAEIMWATTNPEWFDETFSIEITLDHAVWHDLRCPLTYKGDKFSIGLDGEIGVWPGAENMPVAESFDTRK